MRTAPFDLEKALAGHPLVTRDGLRVKEFSESPDADFPFFATYENRDTSSYTHKGTYFIDEISQKDLFLLLPDEPEQSVKKTVHDYLRELPEPYRSKALVIADESKLYQECDSMYKAISMFQKWNKTPQGYPYWEEVCHHYIHGTPMPEPLKPEQPATEQPRPMPDSVNHPPYYNRGAIEVRDFIQDQELNNCRGNAIKYICRAGFKGDTIHHEIEDLEKAKNNIQAEIDYLKRKHKLN